jgi:hypothetical protein
LTRAAGEIPKGSYTSQHIDNHTDFKRTRQPLFNCMNLDLYALGGVLTVSTFDGRVKLKVTEELKM